MKGTRDDASPARGQRCRPPRGGTKRDTGGKANGRLKMCDALSYVREVKDAFGDQPGKYDMFLDLMKDFKSRRIDKATVVARAKELFEGHDGLIPGFNIFLPKGCEIAPHRPPARKEAVNFEEAIGLIHKVKDRFQDKEHVYISFHNILQTYRRGNDIGAVYKEVADLFTGHPDLLESFKRFLPESFRRREELNYTGPRGLRQLRARLPQQDLRFSRCE